MLLITNSALRKDNVRCEDHLHLSSNQTNDCFPLNSARTHSSSERIVVESCIHALSHATRINQVSADLSTLFYSITPPHPTFHNAHQNCAVHTYIRTPPFISFLRNDYTNSLHSQRRTHCLSQIRICGDRDNLRTPPSTTSQNSSRRACV